MAKYVDWLQECNISAWQRIDQGIDIDGTGYFVAIGSGHVTQVAPGGWSPYGNYLEYRLTDSGSLQNMHVYHAEGVNAVVSKGDWVSPGQRLCGLIPGWQYATESGWAAGNGGYSSWARVYGGGYSEGECTQAGISFNRLTERLHGHSGSTCQGPVGGTAPNISLDGVTSGGGGGGGGNPPPPLPQLEVGPYDWSPRVANSGNTIAWYGGHAMDNAHYVEIILRNARYCDINGVR